MAKFPKQNLRNGLKAVINNWLSIKKTKANHKKCNLCLVKINFFNILIIFINLSTFNFSF